MKKTFRSLFRLRLVYLATTLFLVALCFFVFKQVERLAESSRWVNHSNEVTLAIERIQSSLQSAQSAHRGYLLTHDSSFLETFQQSLADYPLHIKKVRELTIDNPVQQKNIDEIERIGKAREVHMVELLRVDQVRTPTEAEMIFGKSIMDSLGDRIGLMIDIENKLLGSRTQVLESQTKITPALLLILSLGALSILLISYNRLNTELKNSISLQKQQQLLVMEAPAIICMMRGPDHVFKMVNEQYMKLIDQRDMLGKPIREALPELQGQGFYELLDHVFKTGETQTGTEVPVKLNTSKGTLKELYVNFVFRSSTNAKGEIDGLLVYGSDVTEQVVARKEIEESEERYHNLIYTSPSAIGILKGEDLVITTANDAIIEIWGKGREIMGKKYFEALPELAEQGYREVFREVYKTGKPFSAVETPVNILQHGRNRLKYYNFILYAQRNAIGQIEGIGIIATEVTTQALINKKIQESEGRFRLLAEALPQLVWVTNAVGMNEYTSERWEEYTGVKPRGLEEWVAIVHPDDLNEINAVWMHCLSTGEIYKHDVRLKGRSGEYRWFTVNGEPVRDEENRIVKWVGAFTDVHTQKEFSQQLEKQVQERTHELALKNLDLEKMNKELESFTYISSHDLQEPLRKIQTFSTRILEKESTVLSETGKDYFKRMQGAAGRMQRLIEDLLAFSRASTGERKFEKISLNTIMEEVKIELKESMAEKQAIVEVAELCEANIIPFQFRQLMHNLIGNALKFTKDNTAPHISIDSEKILLGEAIQKNKLLTNLPPVLANGGKEYCHIRVIDRGIGFEPHFNERIFEVFQRLHGKNEYVGTGIGLAIVKKIVENHGGLITATGEIDKGATFDIYIPGE